MSIPESARDIFGNLLHKIKNDYEDVISVYLFGSLAGGEWTDSSDLDVGVVLESAEGVDKRPVPFILDNTCVELHINDRSRFENIEGGRYVP